MIAAFLIPLSQHIKRLRRYQNNPGKILVKKITFYTKTAVADFFPNFLRTE